MRAPGFIRVPFAFSGDKTAIPDAAQPSGQVSMVQGWGPDYQKDLSSDPTAKAIDRQQTNQLMYLMTTLLQRWQTEAFPEWIDAAANGGSAHPYARGTIVRVANGVSWVLRMSMVEGNTATPSAASGTAAWADVDAALSNSVLRNFAGAQDMVGALNVGAGSQVLGSAPSTAANDKRMATLEWATAGKNSTHPASGTCYYIAPWWLSGNGQRRHVDMWGGTRLSLTGEEYNGRRLYQVTVNLPFAMAPNYNIMAMLSADAGAPLRFIPLSWSIGILNDSQFVVSASVDKNFPGLPTDIAAMWKVTGAVAE